MNLIHWSRSQFQSIIHHLEDDACKIVGWIKVVDKMLFLTCKDRRGVMCGVIWAVSFAWELLYHLVNTLIVPDVVATPGVVWICPAHQQLILLHPGQHSDVIVTFILRLPLHFAQLSVSLPGVPHNPLVSVLSQISETQIVNIVSCSNQQRMSVLFQQFKMIWMSLIANKGEKISSCNKEVLGWVSSYFHMWRETWYLRQIAMFR